MADSNLLIYLVLLIAASMFFSLCAIALRTFSLAKLRESCEAIKRPQRADGLIKNTEKLTLSCGLYRLIANVAILLLLVAIFRQAQPPGLQKIEYLFIFIISMVIFSIFSMAIPHAWAKYGGEKVLSRTYDLLMVFSYALWPVVYILQWYDVPIRRLAGIADTTPETEEEEKQEEFLTDLEQHMMEGIVDKEEQEMIESVLELSETTVDGIMTPRTDIVAVEVNSTLQTLLDAISSQGHSRVPIYEGNIDNVIGFVYAKDLLTEIGKNPADFKLREKVRPAYFVPETKPLRDLLHEFQNQKLHIAVVLDEYGGTAGIVSIEDILEELVGEISDEYDKSKPEPVKRIDANTIELDAKTNISDLNSRFELNLPEEEDYDTLAGFVFSHLGHIPKTGETFDYNNLRLTIVSAETRRIKRIRIQKVGER